VLVEPEPLVVHAGGDDIEPREIRDLLRRAPTVTVVVGSADPLVAACFDITLDDDAAIDDVRRAVRAHPLSALAAVTLLRASEGVDVWAGLANESSTYAALLGGADYGAWLATQTQLMDPRPAVRTVRDGEQLTITLDRPHVHNAFNTAMRDGLVEALRLGALSTDITRVDLRGAGESFCSGGDLGEFGMVPDPPTAHAVRLTRHPGWWMHACRQKVVAHLHGACIGAGIELPAFAGRVEATADAWFALPEVGMGLVPGAGGTVSITARVGRQRCAWMALTGARVDAATALRWGLIDEIVETAAPVSPDAGTGRRSPS
jgi:enoyl-CoA hydratase/carnithine racemase